jgi:NAD(P)-dependent dehydrogenase (short-subunit alcohol dehydrogenase family)
MTEASGRFAGRTAIVTGASRGIGLGIAQRLVAEGARLCITARKAADLDDAAAALGGPEHVIAVAGKADDADHRAEAIERAAAAFGPVTLLVNNAGTNPVYGPLIDLDLGAARKTMEVNAIAALGWVQQLYNAGLRESGGSVVNIASVGGLNASPGLGIYGASKAAMIHLTTTLAVELGPEIRVNAVAPGLVKTRFAAALYESGEEAIAASHPMKRLGVAEDIAGAVAFLLSDDASWITGETIVVDGGSTRGRGRG